MERVFWKLSEMYRVRIESLAATGPSVAEHLRHAGSTISREQRRGCEAEQADAPGRRQLPGGVDRGRRSFAKQIGVPKMSTWPPNPQRWCYSIFMSTEMVCESLNYRGVGFASIADVDRIGRRFVQRPFSTEVLERVQEYRRFRANCLPRMLQMVQQAQIPDRSLVSARLKRLDTIHEKLSRKRCKFKLGTLDDVIGVRIVCQDLETVLEVSERIRGLDVCHRVKDYISDKHPAKTTYRGIHHILRFRQPISTDRGLSVRFEVQVRTYFQHQWAVTSESFGEAMKLGIGRPDQIAYLRDLSNKIESWEQAHPSEIQHPLLEFESAQNYGVVWRQSSLTIPLLQLFGEIGEAADRVTGLENSFPSRREHALLLVAVSDTAFARELLQITHPLYVLGMVPRPSTWMPRDT